jgi:hypothetical protein
MSYELDLWGKYRSGALAAGNDLAASRYYRETIRITGRGRRRRRVLPAARRRRAPRRVRGNAQDAD